MNGKMELELQVFNTELGSLCEIKSISKARMSQVTKSAIKAIKMYKHVVQSVEKFIAKCRPEQKVSGLYVIDSIVRQSRHQYGPEKDVFGPRFTRNFKQTFQNLFNTCPVADKPKVVRVLNLWQLNNVFPADVIQPLLDMADPNAPIKVSDSPPTGSAGDSKEFVKHLHKLAHNLGVLKDKGKNGAGQNTRFNKKLLAYDYGDDDNLGGEEDDDDDEPRGETPTEAEPPVSETVAAVEREEESNDLATTISKNLLMNPELLQKLQQIQQLKQLQPSDSFKPSSSSSFNNGDSICSSKSVPSSHTQSKDNSSWFSNQRSHHEQSEVDSFNSSRSSYHEHSGRREKETINSPPLPPPSSSSSSSRRRRSRRSHSRSHSRSPRQRTRSDSRRDSYEKDRPLSPESLQRQKERERRRKGLPPVKEGHAIISSTTLWLGHVPKLISEDEIKDAFKEFGEIESIDLIPSRGCGYVLLKERSAAHKALQQNAKGFRLSGSNIKMAWAPGKGVKGKEYKDHWDLENGCTYIPHHLLDQLPVTQLDQLAEGGVIDMDSLPPHVRDAYEQLTAASASTVTPESSEVERDSNNVMLPGVVPLDQVMPPFMLLPGMRLAPPAPGPNMPQLTALPPPLPPLPLLAQSTPPPPKPPHPSSGMMMDAFLACLRNMRPPPPPPVPGGRAIVPPAPSSVAIQPNIAPTSSMNMFANQSGSMPWPASSALPPPPLPPPPPQVNSRHLTGSNAQPLGMSQFNRSLFPPSLPPPYPSSVLPKPDDQMHSSHDNIEDPFGPSAFEIKAMERKKLPPHSLLPHSYLHPRFE